MVRSPSATSVGDVVDLISVAVGGGDVSTALAVYGRKNKFFVPSSKNPLSRNTWCMLLSTDCVTPAPVRLSNTGFIAGANTFWQ